MSNAAIVLMVVNSPSSGPRRLTEWLEEDGLEIRERLAAEGLPSDLAQVDALVLLGGGLMPDEFGRAPWLREERALARQAIKEDLPTLGICLGGQLLADIAGGTVRAKTGPKERGATLIRTTAAGAADPVIGGLGAGAPMIENHQDMITELPSDAVLLASSQAVENQAFRIGERVRGLQFHPEASAEGLVHWDGAALAADGLSRNELVAEAQLVDAENTAASRRLVDAFAAEIQAHVQTRSETR